MAERRIMTITSNLLDVHEVAEVLRIGESTLRRTLQIGDPEICPPYVKVGGRVMFPLDELEKFYQCKLVREVQ